MNFSKALLFAVCVAVCGCATAPAKKEKRPSLEEIKLSAANGNPAAQRELGVAYDFGQGVERDYAEAAKWYQLAADQGDMIAQNNLGSLYHHGLGVETNFAKALSLYRKSADQGFAFAQTSVGMFYDLGLGVAENPVEGNKWYGLAAEQGDSKAMFNLGVNYGLGRGVAKDRIRALMWLDLARFFTQGSADMKTKWTIRDCLDDLKKQMKPSEILEGERLSNEWFKKFRQSRTGS